MGGKLVVSFLLMLGISYVFVNAQIEEVFDVTFTQINHEIPKSTLEVREVDSKNARLCTLCEEFASQALEYLSQNKTQTEIINSLHRACSELHSLEQQCMLLVDYYAPLFFLEIDTISPDQFCTKVNLCEDLSGISPLRGDDTCTICQDAVSEILRKLKDPDTELEIIEALLKLCNKVERYTQQCKKLVFEYGPVILVNAEKFIEKTDFCNRIHACKANGQLAE